MPISTSSRSTVPLELDPNRAAFRDEAAQAETAARIRELLK